MEQMKKVSKLELFLTFLKLGLFSFGGGPVMLTLVEDELVHKKGWISKEELMEIIAISESTPGPIAINLATYLGYQKQKFWGSLLSTLGVALPTFLCMFLISLFFRSLLQYEFIEYAFMGVKCAVIFLIFKVAINLMRHLKDNYFGIGLFIITGILLVIFHYLNIDFSAIYFILIGGLIGIILYGLILPKRQAKTKEEQQWFSSHCS